MHSESGPSNTDWFAASVPGILKKALEMRYDLIVKTQPENGMIMQSLQFNMIEVRLNSAQLPVNSEDTDIMVQRKAQAQKITGHLHARR